MALLPALLARVAERNSAEVPDQDDATALDEVEDGRDDLVLRNPLLRQRLHQLEHRRPTGRLTGFSEVSAFTRAVRRWFGRTPARVREEAGSSERGS